MQTNKIFSLYNNSIENHVQKYYTKYCSSEVITFAYIFVNFWILSQKNYASMALKNESRQRLISCFDASHIPMKAFCIAQKQ